MTAKIVGTGSYLPEETLTNEQLSLMVETNDEWIWTRTGIKSRHIARNESLADMAIKAARAALTDSKIEAEEIELILTATSSAEDIFPNVSCIVQASIGAAKATCYDLNAACTGFLSALHTATAYIKAGFYHKVLIIGADKMTSLVDFNDRKTCILFGDGAGAAVLTADECGVISILSGADGLQAKVLTCKKNQPIKMDGQEVFKFAVSKVSSLVKELLEENQMTTDELDWLILHQANKRIIQSVARKTKISMEKFPMNLSVCGNTSAASIALVLDEMNKNGKLKRGDKLLLSGFGAGLTWGAALMKW